MLADAIIADLANKYKSVEVNEIVTIYFFANRDAKKCDAILDTLSRKLEGKSPSTIRSAVTALEQFPTIPPATVFDAHRNAATRDFAIAELARMSRPKPRQPSEDAIRPSSCAPISQSCAYVRQILADEHGVDADSNEVEKRCQTVAKTTPQSSPEFVALCVEKMLTTRADQAVPRGRKGVARGTERRGSRRTSSAEPQGHVAQLLSPAEADRRPSHFSLRRGSQVYGSLIDAYMPILTANEMLRCLESVDLNGASTATASPAETLEIMEQSVRIVPPRSQPAAADSSSEPLYPTNRRQGAWAAGGAAALSARWKKAALQRDFCAVDPLTIEFALSQNEFHMDRAREMLRDLFPSDERVRSDRYRQPFITSEDDLTDIKVKLRAKFPTVQSKEINSIVDKVFEENPADPAAALLGTCTDRIGLAFRMHPRDDDGIETQRAAAVAAKVAEFDDLLRRGGMKHLVRFEATPVRHRSREAADRHRADYLRFIKARNQLLQCATLARSTGDFAEYSKLQREGNALHEAAVNAKWSAARKIMSDSGGAVGLPCSSRNPQQLDLHGLFVDEAIHFLDEKLKACAVSTDADEAHAIPLLHVITGVGKHSPASRGPRLRLAVAEHLHAGGWRWRDGQQGVLLVSLLFRDRHGHGNKGV